MIGRLCKVGAVLCNCWGGTRDLADSLDKQTQPFRQIQARRREGKPCACQGAAGNRPIDGRTLQSAAMEAGTAMGSALPLRTACAEYAHASRNDSPTNHHADRSRPATPIISRPFRPCIANALAFIVESQPIYYRRRCHTFRPRTDSPPTL